MATTLFTGTAEPILSGWQADAKRNQSQSFNLIYA